jgi:predicted nucleic acid-binding protein
MTLVVDASVAFKWFAQEDGTDRALVLLEREEPIVAPDLIVAEICNAAWKSLRRRELSPAQFDAIVEDVAQPFSRPVSIEGLIRPATARRAAWIIRSTTACISLSQTPRGCQSSRPSSACLPPSTARAWPAGYHGSDRETAEPGRGEAQGRRVGTRAGKPGEAPRPVL